MTLDKLVKNQVANVGTVIWPLYRVFKERLQLIKFDDIKIIHSTVNEFKQTIREDIKVNGLLCPLVVDKNLNLRNGNHRFKAIKKFGDASIFYKAQSDEEVNFLSRFNVKIWEMHPNVNDLGFCFEGKMKKYTDKCLHLFTTDVRVVKK
jgi:hypothetical protein|tara:strand:- start:1748 stop:2194 length:447 start_codon:yes stop_codon:yes gene_type:complete